MKFPCATQFEIPESYCPPKNRYYLLHLARVQLRLDRRERSFVFAPSISKVSRFMSAKSYSVRTTSCATHQEQRRVSTPAAGAWLQESPIHAHQRKRGTEWNPCMLRPSEAPLTMVPPYVVENLPILYVGSPLLSSTSPGPRLVLVRILVHLNKLSYRTQTHGARRPMSSVTRVLRSPWYIHMASRPHRSLFSSSMSRIVGVVPAHCWLTCAAQKAHVPQLGSIRGLSPEPRSRMEAVVQIPQGFHRGARRDWTSACTAQNDKTSSTAHSAGATISSPSRGSHERFVWDIA